MPDYLAGGEVTLPNGREFALYSVDALAYLDWCDEQGLTVLGFDVWAMAEPQPYAPAHLDEGGNSECCREAIKVIEEKHAPGIIARYGIGPVCSIWVRKPS